MIFSQDCSRKDIYRAFTRKILMAWKNVQVKHSSTDNFLLVLGLPLDRVVQLHGSLKKAFCTNTFCATEMSISAFKGIYYIERTWTNKLDNLLSDNIPITCSSCGSFVKPNIKFFGEPLDEYVNDRIVEVSFWEAIVYNNFNSRISLIVTCLLQLVHRCLWLLPVS